MMASTSIQFFEQQFQRQADGMETTLNPFEEIALPWLRGRVLDYGCGMGNLARAAARRGCEVLALDASPTAIRHLRQAATTERLPLRALEADLRDHRLEEDYDSVVCIGLLMFLPCEQALQQLAQLQQRLRPGGVAIINVLIVGTTYRDMFDPDGHCLLQADELRHCFAGWTIKDEVLQDFPAPGNTVKSFMTLVARKPSVPGSDRLSPA